MNWNKAKTILIVALLITNCTLVFCHYSRIHESIQAQKTESVVVEYMAQMLEDNHIFVDTEIPNREDKMALLSVKYSSALDEKKVEKEIDKLKALPVDKRSDQDMIELSETLIKNCDIMTSAVTFDQIKREGDNVLVTFRNFVNGVPIADNDIVCTIKDGKAIKLERSWFEPNNYGDTKKRISSAVKALIEFMDDQEPIETRGDIHISKIELVYWLDRSAFDAEAPVADTLFPAWAITYGEGEISYINAINR